MFRRVRRSWLDTFRRGGATLEHIAALRANLRLLRETERELGDGLRARLLNVEERLDADTHHLLAEWEAIEKSSRSRAAKQLALRTLYIALANKYVLAVRGDASGAMDKTPTRLD